MKLLLKVFFTMFLAAFDVFWVIAGVELFVVEESAGAELLDGGAVPARPEADARIDVTEDAVLVVASTFRNRWIYSQQKKNH